MQAGSQKGRPQRSCRLGPPRGVATQNYSHQIHTPTRPHVVHTAHHTNSIPHCRQKTTAKPAIPLRYAMLACEFLNSWSGAPPRPTTLPLVVPARPLHVVAVRPGHVRGKQLALPSIIHPPGSAGKVAAGARRDGGKERPGGVTQRQRRGAERGGRRRTSSLDSMS